MSCGADTTANDLMISLLEGEEIPAFPEVDFDDPQFGIPSEIDNPLYGSITKLTNADLTSKQVDGSGMFDWLMTSVKAHLKEEFDKSRITGAEYTKAYIALVSEAMSTAVQYLLGKDQAYWQAVAAQMQARIAETQAITARIGLETAKYQLVSAKLDALNAKSSYALNKIKLATEDENYCIAKYNHEEILPAQKDNLLAQKLLIGEQMESARAQTMDTRTDTSPIAGSLGKQKDLYAQQIVSYQRDAEVKAAKIWTDAWTVMKTIDEGLLPPSNFDNTTLDEVLTTLKNNNDL